MSDNSVQITQLENQLENMKYFQDQADAVERLAKNKDFKALILDGFCRDETARLAHVSGDPGIDKDQRRVAADMSRAGGHLKRFLNIIVQQNNTAQRDRPDIEDMLAELRRTDGAE